jgi:hypothetical protein
MTETMLVFDVCVTKLAGYIEEMPGSGRPASF